MNNNNDLSYFYCEVLLHGSDAYTALIHKGG